MGSTSLLLAEHVNGSACRPGPLFLVNDSVGRFRAPKMIATERRQVTCSCCDREKHCNDFERAAASKLKKLAAVGHIKQQKASRTCVESAAQLAAAVTSSSKQKGLLKTPRLSLVGARLHGKYEETSA